MAWKEISKYVSCQLAFLIGWLISEIFFAVPKLFLVKQQEWQQFTQQRIYAHKDWQDSIFQKKPK